MLQCVADTTQQSKTQERQTQRKKWITGVLQCVAVCYSVLQRVAMCCRHHAPVKEERKAGAKKKMPSESIMPHIKASARELLSTCVAACCSVLQCVAVCCSVLQCVAVCCSVLESESIMPQINASARRLLSTCVAVCCRVLQCVAVYCSVLQCVAVCCRAKAFLCISRQVPESC